MNKAWYQPEKDLFSRDNISDKGIWIEGALSFCINTGTYCNFSCKFCLSNSGPKGTNKSDWIEKALVNLNKIAGPSRIIWAGGEPTLMKDLDTLLSISKSLGNINIVTTNGSIGFSSPNVDWIDFSIYGVNDRSYKKMTGIEMCNSVWNNVKLAVLNKSKVSVNSILNVNPTSTVIEIIERCYQIGIRRVKLHRPLPLGRFKKQIPEIETQKALLTIRDYVPSEMIITYPLTRNSKEMFSGYWVIKPPGFFSNNCSRFSLDDHEIIRKEINNNLKKHYKIFVLD